MAAILIVEDDKTTNDLISDYLSDAGHSIYQVYDGVEALTVFEKEAIELVILDIMLPNLNGLQVLKGNSQNQRYSRADADCVER